MLHFVGHILLCVQTLISFGVGHGKNVKESSDSLSQLTVPHYVPFFHAQAEMDWAFAFAQISI